MAQLLVRNLDPAIKARLRSRAAGHGVSMEEEARDILREALSRETATEGLGQQITRIFARIGLKGDEAIPELKGRVASPADFS